MAIETPTLTSFFTRLKIVFDKIPIKAKFLKDLDFNVSYSGFRYFMQGRKNIPSDALMTSLCDNMEYELVTIPIKKNNEQQAIKEQLENQFFGDLDVYLKKYGDDPVRSYVKDVSGESSVSNAIDAFSIEDVFADHDEKIDINDLF